MMSFNRECTHAVVTPGNAYNPPEFYCLLHLDRDCSCCPHSFTQEEYEERLDAYYDTLFDAL